jgi:YVTN family beta-propeller protein
VIDGQKETAAASISVGDNPEGIALDVSNRVGFVTDLTSGNVTRIDLSTDRTTGSVAVGVYPVGVALDPRNGDVYVANSGSNNLSVFNGTTGAKVASLPVGQDPQGVAFDPSNGEVYVANEGSENLSVIDATSNQVVGMVRVGSEPEWICYDPSNGYLFVTNYGSGSISVLGTRYPVNFVATGLPAGTQWSVSVNGTSNETTLSSIGFVEPNGTNYRFTVGPIGGLVPNPAAGTFAVSGSARTVGIEFTPYLYQVHFIETGLPGGTNWSVTLDGGTNHSQGNMVGFRLPNGTGYAFSVSAVSGYSAFPATGSMNVSASPVTEVIAFTPVKYAVWFNETGLPAGSNWSVTFNRTPQSAVGASIRFDVANGTGYAFTVGGVPGHTSTPSAGTLSITGSSVTERITFTAAVVSPRPMAVRAWGNTTGSGGGGNYCIDDTGKFATHPFWLNVSFEARASNGTEPYSYVWNFADGSPNPTGVRVTHNFTGYGSWDVKVTARDSTGTTMSTNVTVQANAPPDPIPNCPTSGSSFFGLPAWEGYTVLAGFAAALAAIVLFVVWSQKRNRTPPER